MCADVSRAALTPKPPGDNGRQSYDAGPLLFNALAAAALNRQDAFAEDQRLDLERAFIAAGKSGLLPTSFFHRSIAVDRPTRPDEPDMLPDPDKDELEAMLLSQEPPKPPPRTDPILAIPKKAPPPLLPASLTSKLVAEFDVAIPGMPRPK